MEVLRFVSNCQTLKETSPSFIACLNTFFGLFFGEDAKGAPPEPQLSEEVSQVAFFPSEPRLASLHFENGSFAVSCVALLPSKQFPCPYFATISHEIPALALTNTTKHGISDLFLSTKTQLQRLP
jgi:hypothetical protein